jgi:hypothetical protein
VQRFTGCAFVLLIAATGFAQDQERKLIDRLLRPDMELKNDAQDKKFVADRTAINKQANVGTYYLQQKCKPKRFTRIKQLSAPECGTADFAGGKRQAAATSPSQTRNAQRQIPARSTTDVHTVHDSNRIAQSSSFAGKRQFLDKGKSQKSLNQKSEPLTIDEIRELLNKNK